jgi:tryptophan synthase alpha subunit
VADAVVVGSAFVDQVRDHPGSAEAAVLDVVGTLAGAVRGARA